MARVVPFASGRGAGRVARRRLLDLHDLLRVIHGAACHAREELEPEPDHPGLAHLELVIAAAQDAADLVRALPAFDGGEDEPRTLGLDEILREIEPGILACLGGRNALAVDLGAPGLHVIATRRRFQAVLGLLTLEARASLPPGATLTLRTEHRPAPSLPAPPPPAPPPPAPSPPAPSPSAPGQGNPQGDPPAQGRGGNRGQDRGQGHGGAQGHVRLTVGSAAGGPVFTALWPLCTQDRAKNAQVM